MTRLRSLPWRRILLLSIVPIALLFHLRAVRYDQRRTIKRFSVADLAFVDNGRKLAVVSRMGDFWVYDVPSRTLLAHKDSGAGMVGMPRSFYQSGKSFVWFGAEENLELWSTLPLRRQAVISWHGKLRGAKSYREHRGEKIVTIGDFTDELSTGLISHDGKQLVTTTNFSVEEGDVLWCWNVKNQKLLWSYEMEPKGKEKYGEKVSSVAFSPNGSTVTANTANGKLFVLDSQNGELKFLIASNKATATVEFSPDNSRIAAAGLAEGERNYTNWVKIFNANTGNLQHSWRLSVNTSKLQFAPDSRTLAVGLANGRIELYDAAFGKYLRALKSHRGSITALTFSPDGKTLASASADGTIKFWDLS